jgi:hypothetical protein
VRKLVLTTFASVDGVMQSPGAPDEDRSGGFEMGGWLVPDPAWRPATVIVGDLVTEISRLKADGDGELQVHGSRRLARSLIGQGLVDEYRLWVFPVLLGAGERLFGDGPPPTGLRMVGSRTSESGVVVHTYQPAGPLTFGSFQPGADGRA